MFEYSAPLAMALIVQVSRGDLVIQTFVPAVNVILSCLLPKAFDRFEILIITRLPVGNDTELFTTNFDRFVDDEINVPLCKLEIVENVKLLLLDAHKFVVVIEPVFIFCGAKFIVVRLTKDAFAADKFSVLTDSVPTESVVSGFELLFPSRFT